MDEAHITCNKNTVPNDPRSPFVTSGVRLGTPAVTSRGMVEKDMDKIAEAIALVVKEPEKIWNGKIHRKRTYRKISISIMMILTTGLACARPVVLDITETFIHLSFEFPIV